MYDGSTYDKTHCIEIHALYVHRQKSSAYIPGTKDKLLIALISLSPASKFPNEAEIENSDEDTRFDAANFLDLIK